MTIKTPAKLFLIPHYLATEPLADEIPLLKHELAAIKHLRNFIVENEKPARRLLKLLLPDVPQSSFHISEIGKHAEMDEALRNFENWSKTGDIGLISDCGVPAIADPGAIIVSKAHQLGVSVVPLTGPSSILLTLMASGFNGQSFVFHGYLPIDPVARTKFLQRIEADASKQKQTQVFMETPFRNMTLLNQLCSTLKVDTQLCIGAGIHTPHQLFQSQSIARWKAKLPEIHKVPAIFAIYR